MTTTAAHAHAADASRDTEAGADTASATPARPELPAVPAGFALGAIHAGIKSNPAAEDLVLIAADRPCTAAGVYTTTRTPAAPVLVDRARTPSASVRAVVVNSGNANACTGARGLEDALEMAACAGAAVGAAGDEVLVLSTGIIGVPLPMKTIEAGVARLGAALGSDAASLVAAARGMMTTDTVPKIAGRTAKLGRTTVRITGLAKGAAMIAPALAGRTATMLGVFMTDVELSPRLAQQLLERAVAHSFNCISVDGHQSTNDSVLLLASGAAGGGPLDAASPAEVDCFAAALGDACIELARAIPADGEGAEHLVTIDVTGAPTRDEAHRVARAIAESPLVKTAIAGADPNWGRIVSAVGNAGVELDPDAIELELNGTVLYSSGAPVPFDAPAVSRTMRDERDVSVVVRLGDGPSSVRFWTTDLTTEYVRLNAEYTT